MDIGWGAIGKVLLAGVATYIFLPAFLIARDFVLWKAINAYVLNDGLRREIFRYAVLANHWNMEFACSARMDVVDGAEQYQIRGEIVSQAEWLAWLKAQDKAQAELESVKLFIDRKSRFLTWMLKHYQQDATNPISDWITQAHERTSGKHERS